LSTWLLWIGGCFGYAALLGLLAGNTPWRRWLATFAGAIGLIAPWLVHDAPVLRATIGLEVLWCWLKAIDLCRDPKPRSARFRVLQLLVLYDLRKDGEFGRSGEPEARMGLLFRSLLAAACAALALSLAFFGFRELPSPWQLPARQAAGIAFAYFGVQSVLGFFEFIYRAGGLHPPILHQAPILSRSLNEFWGRRWNRIVGGWLFANFYRPFALRGHPTWGTFAAFAASGVFHMYFTWAAVGAGDALRMGSFFLLQFPLLVLEQKLRLGRARPTVQRLWTLGWLLATSPLFIEPMLHILEGGL
jgi:hypothetical protein